MILYQSETKEKRNPLQININIKKYGFCFIKIYLYGIISPLMEQSMLKRLEASEIRFAEVEKELLDENIMKDMKRFRDVSKERATLEPIVEAYHKYLRIVSDIKDAELMIGDSDPEIAELGHSEHKRLIEEEAALCEELKIALNSLKGAETK